MTKARQVLMADHPQGGIQLCLLGPKRFLFGVPGVAPGPAIDRWIGGLVWWDAVVLSTEILGTWGKEVGCSAIGRSDERSPLTKV